MDAFPTWIVLFQSTTNQMEWRARPPSSVLRLPSFRALDRCPLYGENRRIAHAWYPAGRNEHESHTENQSCALPGALERTAAVTKFGYRVCRDNDDGGGFTSGEHG